MADLAARPQQDRDAGLPAVRSGDRVLTAYSPDLALQIVERIAHGETLSAITKEAGMPARSTFHRWALNHAELARALSAAREMSAYSMEDEALDMARSVRDNPMLQTSATVRAFDVALQQLRWSAAKRNPRVYSERSAVNVTVPIQINTSLDLSTDQVAKGEELPDIYTITAKVPLSDQEKELTHEQFMGSEVGLKGEPVGPLVDFRPREQRPEKGLVGSKHEPPAGPPARRGRPPKGPPEPAKERAPRRRGHYGD